MDAQLINILVCPVCKGPLVKRASDAYLICKSDKLAFPVRDGIPIMLVDQAEPVLENHDAPRPL